MNFDVHLSQTVEDANGRISDLEAKPDKTLYDIGSLMRLHSYFIDAMSYAAWRGYEHIWKLEAEKEPRTRAEAYRKLRYANESKRWNRETQDVHMARWAELQIIKERMETI